MHTSSTQLIVFAVTAVLILVVFGFRARRMMTATVFNPDRALIYPAVLTAVGVWVLVMANPQGVEWAWVIAGLVVGGGLGWLRASTVRMSVDPATGRLMAQGSILALLFLIVLLIVRTGMRQLLSSNAAALGIRFAMADVILLALAVGLLGARALEMTLRGRKLLALHRANPALITTDDAGV